MDSNEVSPGVKLSHEQSSAATKFVMVWAGSGLASDLIRDYGCTLTCSEADAMAELFKVFGYPEIASVILEDHSKYDEPGDLHYVGE